ncbi:hypothetical protein [Enterovirga aerilata]|uniref:BA14K family protein n=1 Tax=Enterovirga aerilata TaxID=2730920 RepID=A0A849IH05_9HYPH|nr:hypothetical protein [Enterovirga sp. DB1703]NNM75217.1 hypothetical protein [Enterovirga sp. DB1703]
MRLVIMAAGAVAVGAALAGPAAADGHPPFYGYSPYLGGPAAYFTPEDDVRAASVQSDGLPGMGTRTYYRGGPFFTYQSVRPKPAAMPRHSRRRALVTKG